MKKWILIALLFISFGAGAQTPKTYQVTKTGSYDVPAGKTWMIHSIPAMVIIVVTGKDKEVFVQGHDQNYCMVGAGEAKIYSAYPVAFEGGSKLYFTLATDMPVVVYEYNK